MIDETDASFALRMKKIPVKQTAEYRVNILFALRCRSNIDDDDDDDDDDVRFIINVKFYTQKAPVPN